MITTLRDALHENIHNSGVPIKRLADDLGISYSYLANAGNPNLEGFDFQLRWLIPLTKMTGNFSALDYLEASLGRTAFRLPDPTKGDHVEINRQMLHIMKHIGDLGGEIEKALEDNKLDNREAKKIEPIITEVTKHLVQLAAALGMAVSK
jgi:hypothetical protein